jgi:hypothetical protein
MDWDEAVEEAIQREEFIDNSYMWEWDSKHQCFCGLEGCYDIRHLSIANEIYNFFLL